MKIKIGVAVVEVAVVVGEGLVEVVEKTVGVNGEKLKYYYSET